VLTDAGQAAMQQADLIFQLGESLPARVRDAASTPTIRLAVGICDALPKLGGAPAVAAGHQRADVASAVP